MHRLSTLKRFMGLIGLVALLLVSLLWIPTPVSGQDPEDRPTIPPPSATPITPGTTPPTPIVTPSKTVVPPLPEPGSITSLSPSLHGTIINWGFRNEPNVPVRVSGVDWHLDTASDATGHYLFERLGNDVVWLNIILPDESNVKPLTTDVAVRPAIGRETVINLGVYEGSKALALPVSHTMEANTAQAQPGDRVTFTIHIKNNLIAPITHAQLTDYLPAGLGFVSADSDHGPVDHADDLVVARLGTIGPDDEATVTIITLVEPDGAESWTLTNRSSLLYRESIATQASATITVLAGQTNELPVTGIGLPLAALGLGALLLVARRLRTRSAQ